MYSLFGLLKIHQDELTRRVSGKLRYRVICALWGGELTDYSSSNAWFDSDPSTLLCVSVLRGII